MTMMREGGREERVSERLDGVGLLAGVDFYFFLFGIMLGLVTDLTISYTLVRCFCLFCDGVSVLPMYGALARFFRGSSPIGSTFTLRGQSGVLSSKHRF